MSSSDDDPSNFTFRNDPKFDDIFRSWKKKYVDDVSPTIQIQADSRPGDVPLPWKEEITWIFKEIDDKTVTPEENTVKGYFKWVMARDDIRERITSWLDLTKKNEKNSSKNPEKAKQYEEEGNSFFEEHYYVSSVKSYTQSARYATFENNDFSVAVANRSAAFCHLGKYEESLQDMKLAIDCGYPAVSLGKLHLRAVECHVALGNKKSAQEEMDELSEWIDQHAVATSSTKTTILKKVKDLIARMPEKNRAKRAKLSNCDASINPETMLPENKEFPFASSSVMLKTCPKRGRHVVAAKQIKKGELLFVEKPFAWVPESDGNDAELCAHCCGPMDNSKIPCKGCLKALYCGRTCWEDSWPYHQWECPSYQMNLWARNENAHLAFKVMIVSTTISDIRLFNDVHRLKTNFDKIQSADKALSFAITSLMVIIYLEKLTNFFQVVDIKEAFVDKFEDENLSLSDIDLSTIEGKKLYVGTIIYRHFLQMLTNAYAVEGTDDEPRLGTAGYLSSSMLNHSCDPTVINSFWKNWIIVKSLKDVAPGQEIFACYGPHFSDMGRSERQASLYANYHFHCKCEICANLRFHFYAERFKGLKCKSCSGPAQLLEETDTQRCFDCGATSPVNFRDALERADRLFADAEKLFDDGDLKPAIASYEQSLAIREKYLWKYNGDITETFSSLGSAYTFSGSLIRAIFYTEEALLGVQEQYGRENIEVAFDLNFLTLIMIFYLEQSSDRTTDVYRETLKKGKEYLNRMEEIMSLTSGPWCGLYRKMKEKQERFHRIDQQLRALENSPASPKPRNK